MPAANKPYHLLIGLTLIGSILSLLSVSIVSAQDPGDGLRLKDQIEVRRPNTGATTTLQGEIVDFNGNELQFRSSGDKRIQTFAADDILQTRYQQSAEHQSGVELLEKKEYAEADRNLDIALNVEPREWVRRELLALKIRVALARFDYETASNLFIALSASDEHTRHFRLIPLNWRVPPGESDESPAAFPGQVPETTALRWLNDSEPVAQLLGASWLMFRDSDVDHLERTLAKLSRNTNERIQLSAQMQVWRTYVAEARYSENELTRWESRIESLDDLDRSGPYFLLATAYARKLEYSQAAVRWLWLKANRAPDHLLSSTAQYRAAESLVKLGLSRQAIIVYRELAEAYPESPAGKLASERLQSP